MSIKEEAAKMKLASPLMASAPAEKRNSALLHMIENLEAGKEKIFAANRIDLAAAKASGLPPAVMKRLAFDEGKLADSISGIRQLISLPDPVGKVTLARQLDEGLRLYRVTCPIGVIAMIFEARPDAMIQISSLAVKSGNCAILKGGKETKETNRVLFSILHEASTSANLPSEALFQAEQHSEIDELLTCRESVDLIIPRGSNAFVQHIMSRTKIPVMGHADGICHVYVDRAADLDMALDILENAKCSRPSVCNAAEVCLVHREAAPVFLPRMRERLTDARAARGERPVELRLDGTAAGIIPGTPAGPEDFDTEFLDYILAVRVVDGTEEAIRHIAAHSTGHSEAIVTEDGEAARRFLAAVDSAAVYWNASTRFTDGGEFGLGCEMGISTQKLHARGPLGLAELCSFKFVIRGGGQIR